MPRRHLVAYRAMLRLYPRSFRAAYGEPMAQLFGDRLRDRGRRVWLETAPDLVRTVPTQRMEALMANPGTRAVLLALAVLLAVAATLGVGGPAVVPVVAIAVLAVVVVSRARLRAIFGERAPLWPAIVQAWWAPLAGLLGFAMVLAGVGTVFEAHNLGGRIFGSALLMAFGGAMLLGLMRRPFDRVAGNTLVLLATVPPLLFFWMVVPPVMAVLVWVGVLVGGFDEPAPAAT